MILSSLRTLTRHYPFQQPRANFWLKDNGISQVAVCKVDVEGHELEVFEGMKNSLNAGQIGNIVFEC